MKNARPKTSEASALDKCNCTPVYDDSKLSLLPPREEQDTLERPNFNFWDASPEGQRERLLDVLAVTSVTPLEAEENLEIDGLHEHIEELRMDGYNIQSSLYWAVGADGGRKCSVRYELRSGSYKPWGGPISGRASEVYALILGGA